METVKLVVKIFHRNSPSACSQSGRISHYLKNSSTLELNLPSSDTFDSVLLTSVKACNILPLYLPLFALKDSRNDHWVRLSARVGSYQFSPDNQESNSSSNNTPPAPHLEFRIRYTVQLECQLHGVVQQARRYSLTENGFKDVINGNVLQYLFLQRREDFLLDKLPVDKSISDPLSSTLGVAVLDMLRLACELDVDVNEIRNSVNYKKLLPPTSQSEICEMHFFNRMRTTIMFGRYLKHFRTRCSGYVVSFFHSKYLQNLELVVGYKNQESYPLLYNDDFPDDCRKITVDSELGIIKHTREDPVGEVWCDFQQITDLSLQVRNDAKSESTMYIVSISQLDGKCLSLFLPSIHEAENLTSCIDGYYRLLADAHHYLCKEIASPTLVEQLSLLCHGPVSCLFAEHILKAIAYPNVGDCLLRCSLDSYDEYFINTIERVHPEIKTKNYKIDKIGGLLGMYGDEASHCHRSLRSLLEGCAGGLHQGRPIPFNIDHLVSPKINQKCNLLIRRCSDEVYQMQGALGSNSRIVLLMQQEYQLVQNLGDGRFTKTFLYAKKDKPEYQIVAKKVRELEQRHDLGQKQHIDQSFQESIMSFNCLKTDHIVSILGTMQNMLVLEYVPLGSITYFLSSTPEQPSTEWFLHVLWQLTHACTYLEEMDCPHGNITGKNVLLWHDQPKPMIKLSDPGVRTCRKTERQRIITEPVLGAPWLAYEFCSIIPSVSPCATKPTVNGDKWSFATTVCEICDGAVYGSWNPYSLSDELKIGYRNGLVVPIPEMLNALGVGEVCTLIRQCWSSFPLKRPAFRHVLRELQTVLSSDYVLPPTRPARRINQSIEVQETSSPQLKIYKWEHLTRRWQLGEGHFGQVVLYQYDPDKNGRSEPVAVKRLRQDHSQNLDDIQKEIQAMSRINDKYVVRLKGITSCRTGIVMEYLQYPGLAKYLQNKKLDEVPIVQLIPSLLVMASQIAQGMMVLQEHRLIHRDLALRNILLHQRNANSPPFIKISDFGLSRVLKEERSYYAGNPEKFPAQWYAPESLRAGRSGSFYFESDVWSYGVTIWEMFSYGANPKYDALPNITIDDLPRFVRLLHDGERLKQPTHCPGDVYGLMERCWQFDHRHRISFQDLRRSFDNLSADFSSANP